VGGAPEALKLGTEAGERRACVWDREDVRVYDGRDELGDGDYGRVRVSGGSSSECVL